MERKNKIGRGSVTMGKFIGWAGKESFVESVRFCLFHYEGRSRNLISASSPKSRINESLTQARSPFPFPAGMTPPFTFIYQDPSQTKHFFVDSDLGHSPLPEFHIFLLLTSISLLWLHSSFQGTLLARNSSPGIPSLLPSAVLGEVGRFVQIFAHRVSHHVEEE